MEVTTGASGGQLLATYPALSDVQQHQRSCKAKTYFGSCECHSSLRPTSADNRSCPNSASSCTALCSQLHLLSLTPGRTSVQSVSSREKPPQGSPPTSTAPISTQGTNTITKSKTINTNFRVLENRGTRWGEGPSMTNVPLMFISCIHCVDDSLKTSFYNEKSFNEFLWSYGVKSKTKGRAWPLHPAWQASRDLSFPCFLCSNHTLWFFSYPIFSPGDLRMLCPLYILPPYCHLAKLLPCIKHHSQPWTSSEAGTALIKHEFNQVGLPSPSCSHSCRIPPLRQLQGQGWRPSGLSPCPAPSTGPATNWTHWGAHLLFYN